MSYSLDSLRRDYIGEYSRVIKVDLRSLDYGLYGVYRV